MRASVLENDDGSGQTAVLADRRMFGGRNDHQLFVKGERLLKRRIGDWLGDECRVEVARKDGGAQNLRVAGAQFQNHRRMSPVVFAEQSWQPDGRSALHRAKPERPARPGVLHGTARFIGKGEKAVGVVEQYLTSRREVKPFALTNEKRDAQILLKLPDTRRDIGLNAMQPFRRAGDAAFAHNRAEYP